MNDVHSRNERFVGKVARVDYTNQTVVINRGEKHHIRLGEIFHIVQLGDEITDPDTGEILGTREILVGRVQVTHVQESMSTAIALAQERLPGSVVDEASGKSVNALYQLVFPTVGRTVRSVPARTLPKVELNASVGDLLVRV
ncbi:hypothetical protein [Achromobacter mucicolens]|uniref:hypothetical protein n=1 Tax=Achromobacter mucicolens TaxID=1389922 RepID=UPI00289DBA18|nr:hypothetical protein [Achromobacter mucicolens]